MQINGSLSEIPWLDVLRFLDHSRQTGRLTLQTHELGNGLPCFRKPQYLNFWLRRGYILGAAPKLNGQGLLNLMDQQGWISAEADPHISYAATRKTPLGLHLKRQGVLTGQQLHWLFRRQVFDACETAAGLATGTFLFETSSALPYMEMTGIKLSIRELQATVAPQVRISVAPPVQAEVVRQVA